jgi:uncharacterized protein YjbI with pentapeptide repeats
MLSMKAGFYFIESSKRGNQMEKTKLKFLATRYQEFRNLRKWVYLLLCSLTPQQAAGNARAIVFKRMRGVCLSVIVFPVFFLFLSATAVSGFDDADLQRLKSTNQCPGCNLTGVVLQGATFPNAKFAGANVSSASISNSRLANTDFSGANMAYINLTSADLTGANMSNADLRVANLVNAKLEKANLSKANLAGAALMDANLTGANLDGANLAGAFLSGAIWVDGKKCSEGSKGECKK